MLMPRRVRGDDTLYARAKPQKIELTETYFVEQEISRSPSTRQGERCTGRIRVEVPYDGRDYFTRQAVADVWRMLAARGDAGDQRATIGHLLLADHTKTDLRAVMRPHNQAGVIPLSVPVATYDGRLDLTGDRQTCAVTYEYQPDDPLIYPIDLSVELHDLDSLTGAIGTEQTLVTLGREHPSVVIEKLRQKASFSSRLLLRFQVVISIPVKAGSQELEPVVKAMSVEWPTLTSLRSTKLHIENLSPNQADQRFHNGTVRYNPVMGRLEWEELPMRKLAGGPGADAGTQMFGSAAALLRIGHPGELFKEDVLEVKARVEIPHYLLSGLEACGFDATGRRRITLPQRTTTLHIRTLVYPADVFAGRTFSPYQQFSFDNIIPDEMRITDIVSVLRNSGFEVDPPRRPEPQDPLAPTWLLQAQRSQGPDSLGLLVAVEGRRATLDREQIMAPDTKVKGSTESGRLKVSVLGTLPRDHRELTREMNALQQAVRERFRFHQTRS